MLGSKESNQMETSADKWTGSSGRQGNRNCACAYASFGEMIAQTVRWLT